MPLIIGHRGGRHLWPENSLFGFRKLLELPVDGVEFDVHLTKAGELLIIHDPTLDRTTDRSGPVADLPAGEHRKVVLKESDGEAIPTLEEVLDIFVPTKLDLHIELKADATGTPYPGLEKRIADMVAAKGLQDRSILTSFNPDVLAKIREVAPGFKTLSSLDKKSADRMGLESGIRRQLEVSDIIAVERTLLDAEWDKITALIPLDKLGAWVPNEEDDLAYWLNKPIRQITTDRPDRAVKLKGA
jgi:glycerophosphoryl diester phosphodiesterase